MKTFAHPRAAGGMAFAWYNRRWSHIGAYMSTKRVAIGALTALYGSRAAKAAIQHAKEVSGKKR
jgi:hypothetical protein